jgi:hypothetical protein
MAATDYQSLLSSGNVACYNNLSPGLQKLLKLALLQIIANALAPNVPTDYNSLLAQANVSCYRQNDASLLELALLQIIAENGTGGGGGGSGAVFGNYGGGQPNFTPSSGEGMAVDTSTNNLWDYYGGAWHQLV